MIMMFLRGKMTIVVVVVVVVQGRGRVHVEAVKGSRVGVGFLEGGSALYSGF